MIPPDRQSNDPHSAKKNEYPQHHGQTALAVAQVMFNLVRSRRLYFEDFMDGDGPYWTSMGLFIDGEKGVESTLEDVINYADESIETARFLLKSLMERGYVERYICRAGEERFRLTPSYALRFARYLDHQNEILRLPRTD